MLRFFSEVPFSYETLFEYLPPPNQDSFFILTCEKEENFEITSIFKPGKSAASNSIPTKILPLLKYDISEHLSVIFNMLFITGKWILNWHVPTIDEFLFCLILITY